MTDIKHEFDTPQFLHDLFANDEEVSVVFPKRHVRILTRESEAWTFEDDPDMQ